jgi:hypothetical protein
VHSALEVAQTLESHFLVGFVDQDHKQSKIFKLKIKQMDCCKIVKMQPAPWNVRCCLISPSARWVLLCMLCFEDAFGMAYCEGGKLAGSYSTPHC